MNWLLATCSLLFGPGWTYETSGIHLGLRQSAFVQQLMPDGWAIQSAAVSSPWATDFLYTFPRPITRNEKPFITCQILIPTLPTTPNANGRYQYLGIRVTEMCGTQMVWAGIFLSRDSDGPTLAFRPLAGSPTGDLPTGLHFNENDWLTVGLAWSDSGALRAYARTGKAAYLGPMDQIAEDDGTIWNGSAWEQNEIYIKHMTEVRGIFLDIAFSPAETTQPTFVIAKVETRAAIVPTLIISGQLFGKIEQLKLENSDGTLLTNALGLPISDSNLGRFQEAPDTLVGAGISLSCTGYPSERYALQRSLDLAQWETVGTLSDGESFDDALTDDQQFYRLTQ